MADGQEASGAPGLLGDLLSASRPVTAEVDGVRLALDHERDLFVGRTTWQGEAVILSVELSASGPAAPAPEAVASWRRWRDDPGVAETLRRHAAHALLDGAVRWSGESETAAADPGVAQRVQARSVEVYADGSGQVCFVEPSLFGELCLLVTVGPGGAPLLAELVH